ncbi:Lipoxygenase [Macleaya cordata]|uniref:Lipoxygenase n=1 Tax=Macleaya cordata TaxID=56857 RepID=A0A200Q875_MACCD|nr:Lipoxygenase [Macleaya cordata]
MLNLQQVHQSESSPALFLLHNSFLSPHGNSSIPIRSWTVSGRRKPNGGHVKSISNNIRASVTKTTTEKAIKVKGIVTVKMTVGGILSNLGLTRALDDITDLARKSMLIELVSSEVDPKTGKEKETIKDYAEWVSQKDQEVKYECEFMVPASFGEIGAVLVQNEHHKEAFFKDIVFNGLPGGPFTIPCDSWVHSKFDNPDKRIFFANKSYLPSQTPNGLKKMREEELTKVRGNGEGERKTFERIYDYDVYNDLGEPDKSDELARPVIGGPVLPYPRRCRTGRERCIKDPLSESRSNDMYVPRDEAFSEVKQMTFSVKTLRSVLHALVPSLETSLIDTDLGFPYFTAIDSMFNEGIEMPKIKKEGWLFNGLLPRLVKAIADGGEELLLFETPELLDRDKFSWLKDEEFSRQTLAGLNPCSIKLVKEWPLKSKLDPKIYGAPESLITTELVELQIKGMMSVHEAMKQKKLFILDYHDMFLPYVNKVREIEGTTLYGSRTLFFLTEDSTLRPIAIELTRPPNGNKPQWREVFTPSRCNATSSWLWKLAKAHVTAHDSGYHQLVSHWLRTHCATEPYIIAANRQLSAMHPIYRLLFPHFRYTMEINALARQSLINAGGIIESSFTPGKYAIEISSVIYGQEWRFDMEGLPADLVRRGLAVEDPTAKHGLKLIIEDYPFANDGLDLWDALKTWISDYVNHYYPKPELIESDPELQEWWTEVRTKGHADKKDEPWWPVLKTPNDLIFILTTIIWVTSAHHAAVNFGQYHYAGYFPNRPTIARTNMPVEDPTEQQFKRFLERPEATLLECFPSQIQATKVMAVLDVLSNHSPDEEYLGGELEPSWAEDPIINAAFERFNGRLKELEGIIDAKNADLNLRNRAGAGVVPYELLKPFSSPGVTGMGVPNSISI